MATSATISEPPCGLTSSSARSVMQDAKILVVDDDATATDLLRHIFHYYNYHNVVTCNESRGFLALFLEYQPDLIILDLKMPYPDGFQLLEFLQPSINGEHYLPVIVVTAERDYESKRRVLACGAMDIINKPYMAEEVHLRVSNLLRVVYQQRMLQQRKRELEDEVVSRTVELEGYQLRLKETQLEVVLRLAKAAEHHDEDTGRHTQRVTLTCTLLAQGLGLEADKVSLIRDAAPLHDVGKIGVPDSILLKPGKFTDAEFLVMKRHCMIGGDLLSEGHSELVQMAHSIALNHHERWDGTGYCRGLRGAEIPIEARILAVADVFDALTHDRPYKRTWPMAEAVEEIERQAGLHFDPEVVEVFMTLPHVALL